MTLTFSDGLFRLVDIDEETQNQIAAVASKWSCVDITEYTTANIKEAARFRQYADNRAEKVLRRFFITYYEAPTRSLPDFLDPHQHDGVHHILTRSSCYLHHAPGAGKTIEVIVAAYYAEGEGQVLFIVPPTLTTNWVREIFFVTGKVASRSYFPSIAIIPESSKKADVDWTADFIICPDSMIGKQWVLDKLLKIRFKLVAADEGHRYKETTSTRSLALFGGKSDKVRSSGLIKGCRHAILMSGTAEPNGRPMELYAPIYGMAPELIDFMSKHDYGFKYCGARLKENDYAQNAWEFKGSTNEAELRSRIMGDWMHVVTEDQLGLQPRVRSMVFMSKDPRTSEMKDWEKKNLANVSMSELMRDDDRGALAEYRKKLGIAKVPWAIEYIADQLESTNESLLVFGWHRDVVHGIYRGLAKYNPGIIIGGQDLKLRNLYIDQFQRGVLRLIVMNIGAGGEGHNIQRADQNLFFEWGWNDAVNSQAEMRSHRKGRKGVVRSKYFVVPNSIDETQLKICFNKAEKTRKLIG